METLAYFVDSRHMATAQVLKRMSWGGKSKCGRFPCIQLEATESTEGCEEGTSS
jgi:hypothetical protein